MVNSIVNLVPLRKLLHDNEEAIQRALLLFVETTVEDMTLLGEMIKSERMLDASRVAHSLKSRFIYLGNDEAIQNIRKLEALLKKENRSAFDEASLLFKNLNQKIKICITQVENEIKELKK